MSITRDNIVSGPGYVSIDAGDLGAMNSGVKITYEPEYHFARPQRHMNIIKVLKSVERWLVEAEFMEPTLKNLDYMVLGGDGTFTSAGSIGGDDTPAELSTLIVYGTAPGSTHLSRSVQFDTVVAIEPGEWAIDRDNIHSFAGKWLALGDMEDDTVGSVTDS